MVVKEDAGINAGTDFAAENVRPEEPAMLQYTSGSTGSPKGVILTHGNLASNVRDMARAFGMTRDSVTVTWLPFHHDMGLIGSLLYPLSSGARVIGMPPTAFLQRPRRWLAAITKYRGTHSAAPNFAYDLCVRAIPMETRVALDLESWRVACNGSEPVRETTMQQFSDAFAASGFRSSSFVPCYGLAESTVLVDAGGFATGDVRIVDPEHRTLQAPGEEGEIWVAGPSVATGYWRLPEETANVFGARISGGKGPAYLRTGDLGLLRDGRLEVSGRLKDLIIIRGVNHHPQDIEATVATAHSALEAAAGAAFSTEEGGEERLVIVQELGRNHWRSFDGPAIFRAIRHAVGAAHDLQVHAIALVRPQAIPRTTSGKVQRHACRAAFIDRKLDVLAEWNMGAEVAEHGEPARLERWLKERLAAISGIPANEIDVRRPFAEYGLDSQLAAQLSAELEDRIGRPVSVTVAYDYPTIAALAQHLSASDIDQVPTSAAVQAGDAVAIVGMGCRFPGASTPDAYRDLLLEGRDAVSEIPASRWNAAEFYDPESKRAGSMYTRHGAFLDQVDGFDAEFFNITPREAVAMDPQQRLWLEVAWEALENAGLRPSSLAGTRTSVYFGQCSDDYQRLSLARGLEGIDAYTGLGCSRPAAAGRLSHLLGLCGPAIHVDTTCSSSLVAVHLACRSLLDGECDLALAGGVNLMLTPDSTVALCELRALAPDGRSKTFDAGANGYGRGEGCGVVILKRLGDAVAAGDRIEAVIRGSAINHDGRTNGFTAPNGPAQTELIRRALSVSGVEPKDVAYVEAHGTGTLLGDPIEVNALASVFGDRPEERALLIGSAKTNIGHLEGAAGIAGLIKAVIAVRDGEVAPHLHFHRPNPHIAWDQIPIRVAAERSPWPAWSARRIAGVSSFGMSGTNAHVVLEGFPQQAGPDHQGPYLLALSAASPAALRELARRFETHLEVSRNLGDVCYTANTGRSQFRYRLAAMALDSDSMRRQLRDPVVGDANAGSGIEQPALEGADGDRQVLIQRLAEDYLRGAEVNWEVLGGGRKLSLPTYPFQRRRYWLGGAVERAHPLLGRRLPQPAHMVNHHVWETELDLHRFTYLMGHRIHGNILMPVSAYIEMARAAAQAVSGDSPMRLSNLQLHHSLAVPELGARTVQVSLVKSTHDCDFRAYSKQGSQSAWVLHATATIEWTA